MATTHRVLIVNPNSNPRTTRMLVAAARAVAPAHVDVLGVTAAHGPAMITEPVSLRAAAEHTVRAVHGALARDRPDAILVGAFGDPGVPEVRALAAPRPVVGIGAAAIARAATGGRPFAIATTTPALAPALVRLAREQVSTAAVPAGAFRGVFLTDDDPLVLAADPAATVVQLGGAVARAVVAGAEAVAIGGGPLSDAARTLVPPPGVEIVEPVEAGVAHLVAHLVTGVGAPVGLVDVGVGRSGSAPIT